MAFTDPRRLNRRFNADVVATTGVGAGFSGAYTGRSRFAFWLYIRKSGSIRAMRAGLSRVLLVQCNINRVYIIIIITIVAES